MQVKTCPMCGTDTDNREARCLNCDYQFQPTASGPTADLESKAVETGNANTRPDGGTPMLIAWCCFCLGILAIFISMTIKVESWEVGPYASTSGLQSASQKLNAIFLLQIAAGGLFSLFLMLWSVGYIVRAISFLPGKQD